MTTTFVNANLMSELVSARSVTGIIHMINKKSIEWFSKKQNILETATYGLEFLAAQVVTDLIDRLDRNY